MELMPHVKALLDDLLNMCTDITVKRSDIAIANEGQVSDTNLYHQYKAVLDGTATYYSYDTFPYEVLSNVTKWNKVSNNSDYNVTPQDSVLKYGANTITVSGDLSKPKNDIDLGLVGDIWIKRNGGGQYLKLFKNDVKNVALSRSVKDINGNDVEDYPQIKGSEFTPYTFNNFNIFVYDSLTNKFQKIDIDTITEYIEMPDDKSELPQNPKSIDTDSVYTSGEYLYDLDKDGNFIEYVYDDYVSDYVMKNEYSSEKTYYRRIRIRSIFTDDDYKSDDIVYIKFNADGSPVESIDDSIYVKYSNIKYYRTEDISTWIGENIDEYISESDIEVPEGTPYYCKYSNNNSGMVDYSLKVQVNGTMQYRYAPEEEDSKGNKVRYLHYSYGEDTTYGKCKIFYKNVSTETYYYFYYVSNENGSYVYDEETGSYLYDPESSLVKYDRNYISSPFVYEKNSLNEYILVDNYLEDRDCYIYYNTNIETYRLVRVFNDRAINLITNKKATISDAYKDSVAIVMNRYIINKYCPHKDDPRWSITRYDGEVNNYYRELNGLPPIYTTIDQPKIDRLKIDPYYTGTDINPYVYDLSDSEIEYLEDSGILDEIKAQNLDKGYLWHLGKKRIDVIEAREAQAFDILYLGNYSNKNTYQMFMEAYSNSRDYVMQRHYQPEMFDVNAYYGSYVALTILVHALDMCFSRSGDVLTHKLYYDYYTVQMILKSYGFEHTFDQIPLAYRKEVAKNIELLIQNKGTDAIYELVYKIFNVNEIEVFKYFFRKQWLTDENGNYLVDSNGDPIYDLFMAQSPIDSDNVVNDIIDPANRVEYDDITGLDKYWGVYEKDENIKNDLLEYPFNYMNSKYITVNNLISLTELNFNASYLLNYIAECIGDQIMKIDIDGFSEPKSIKDLVIALFAIQSKRYGYDGNIPSDVISVASIMKFDVNREITGIGGTVLDLLEKYYYQVTAYHYDDEKLDDLTGEANPEPSGRDHINELKEIVNTNGAIITPDYRSDVSNKKTVMDYIAEAYLKNLEKDNEATFNLNETSFFNKVLEYRNAAQDVDDYNCFDDVYHCIAVSNMMRDVYKLSDPVWELLCTAHANSSGELNGPKEWKHINFENVWTVLSDSELTDFCSYLMNENLCDPLTGKLIVDDEDNSLLLMYDDTILLSDGLPEISKLNNTEYVYAINISGISRKDLLEIDFRNSSNLPVIVYKKDSILPDSGYADTIEDRYVVNGNLITTSKRDDAKIGTYFIEVVNDGKGGYDISLYQYVDIALTFEMYLKYESPELYEYLQLRSGEEVDISKYYQRIGDLFSTIIASLENSIYDDDIRNQLNLSYIDFSNIIKYIKLVIEVFKSYTVDLASADSIYDINDVDNNRIKTIDDLFINEDSYISSNINMNSKIGFEEYFSVDTVSTIRDEILIEELANNS